MNVIAMKSKTLTRWDTCTLTENEDHFIPQYLNILPSVKGAKQLVKHVHWDGTISH